MVFGIVANTVIFEANTLVLGATTVVYMANSVAFGANTVVEEVSLKCHRNG